jgi:hypothetical protein
MEFDVVHPALLARGNFVCPLFGDCSEVASEKISGKARKGTGI